MLYPWLIRSVLGIIRRSLKKYENIWMFILISDALLTLPSLPSPHSSYKMYFQESWITYPSPADEDSLSTWSGRICCCFSLLQFIFSVAVGFSNASSFSEFKAGKIMETGFLHNRSEELLHDAATFEMNFLDKHQTLI